MIAVSKSGQQVESSAGADQAFLEMAPRIVRQAEFALRRLRPEARQDAVMEVLAIAFVAFVRLAELGKANLAFASVLARYGLKQYRSGRRVGGNQRLRDVMSQRVQRKTGCRVESLETRKCRDPQWEESVLHDTRRAPVPDIVSFRIDFASWLAALPAQQRQIAETLSLGYNGAEVSKLFRVSAARISQIRRDLWLSWERFQGAPLDLASLPESENLARRCRTGASEIVPV